MELVPSLNEFFDAALEDLTCDPKTRSYIVGVFTKYGKTAFDLPNESITLTFFQAKQRQDFATYQSLGDWVFFTRAAFPEHLASASDDYYLTVGQISYWSCYRLIKRQWQLFEELADDFARLESEARELIATASLPTALHPDTQPLHSELYRPPGT